jgi:hypothetical protein
MDKKPGQIGVMHAFLCFELYTKLKTNGCVETLSFDVVTLWPLEAQSRHTLPW